MFRIHSFLLGSLLLVAPFCQASLIGDEVEIQWYFPDLVSPVAPHFGPFTVEAGLGDAQLENAQDITLNVEASSLHILFNPANGPIDWLDAAFNGPVFMDLDWVGMPAAAITGVDVAATVTGFTDDRVTFDGHSVAVDFAGLTHTGGEVSVQLTYRVPEPSTVLLMLAGLIGSMIGKLTGGCSSICNRPKNAFGSPSI